MQCSTAFAHRVPPALTVKPRLARVLLLILLLLLLVFGCGYAGYYLSERSGIRDLAEGGERQLELNARAVESEITKYTYLPSLLELEYNVGRLLQTPTTHHLPPAAGQRLPRRPQPAQRQPGHLRAGPQRPRAGHQQLARAKQLPR